MAPPMNRNKHYYAVHPLMRSSVQIHVRWFLFSFCFSRCCAHVFLPSGMIAISNRREKSMLLKSLLGGCCKAGVGEEPFSPDLLWCLLWNILLFGWQWECCSTAIFSLWKSCRQTTGNIASSVCLSVGLDLLCSAFSRMLRFVCYAIKWN